MSFAELQTLRAEVRLGVGAFLRCSDLSKSSYSRRKHQARENLPAGLQKRLNVCTLSIPA
jgi:hypothetical protein